MVGGCWHRVAAVLSHEAVKTYAMESSPVFLTVKVATAAAPAASVSGDPTLVTTTVKLLIRTVMESDALSAALLAVATIAPVAFGLPTAVYGADRAVLSCAATAIVPELAVHVAAPWQLMFQEYVAPTAFGL